MLLLSGRRANCGAAKAAYQCAAYRMTESGAHYGADNRTNPTARYGSFAGGIATGGEHNGKAS